MAVEEVGVKLLAEGSDKFERDIRGANRALDAFISGIEIGSRDIAGSTASAERAIDRFAESAIDSFNRVDGATEIVTGALRHVGEMAIDSLFSAGEAFAGFLVDSVSVAADFQSTLLTFSSVTGSALEEAGMSVDDFSDLFLQLGADTQFSAQQAADAAVELAKGGLDPATIAAGGLESALNLAAAGNLDLAAAGEIVAKQLGVWSDKGVTATQITDLLAQAANASTVDVDELANGLANVQGRAAAVGVEYEDLVQTMALIAPGFESASTAGTSLNNFLARLIPTSDSAVAGMEALGLVTELGESLFFDAAGSFIGMEQASVLLQAGMANLTEEEKAFNLQLAFGNDAMVAAIAIAEGGPAGFSAMGDSMALAGTAAEQADKKNQGWNFSVNTLMGSIETGQIQVVLPFLDSMAKYVDRVTEAVNATFAFADSIRTAEDPAGLLLARIDEVIPGFANLATTISALPATIMEVSSAFLDEFAPEIQLAQSIIETAMVIIGAIIDSVMSVASDAIDAFTRDMGQGFFISSDVIEAFQELWVALEPILLGVLKALGAAVLVFVGVMLGMFTGILNAAEPFLQGLVVVLDAVVFALEGVAKFAEGFTNLITALFQKNGEGVALAFQQMDQAVRQIILGMAGAILAAFGTLVITALAFIQGLYEGVTGFFQTLYHDLVGASIVVDLVNDILEWFAKLPERGLALVGELVEGIKGFFTDTDWAALGQGIIDGIISGITNAAGALATAAQSAASNAYNAVTDFLGMSSPSKLFADVGLGTMEGLAIGIEDGAFAPIASLESALASLAMDVPAMMPAPVSALAPSPVANNYNSTTNVYQGDSFGINVRSNETAGSVGNTVRALQSLNSVRRG